MTPSQPSENNMVESEATDATINAKRLIVGSGSTCASGAKSATASSRRASNSSPSSIAPISIPSSRKSSQHCCASLALSTKSVVEVGSSEHRISSCIVRASYWFIVDNVMTGSSSESHGPPSNENVTTLYTSHKTKTAQRVAVATATG